MRISLSDLPDLWEVIALSIIDKVYNLADVGAKCDRLNLAIFRTLLQEGRFSICFLVRKAIASRLTVCQKE